MVKWDLSKRYIVSILCFWGLSNLFGMRVILSVSIVSMVNSTGNTLGNSTVSITECLAHIQTDRPSQESLKGETYDWDVFTQGYILSAFYYGYSILMFPGGYLAEKAGAVRLFGVSVLFSSVCTLLTPVVVRWGVVPLIVLRFFQGLGEGAALPSLMAIIGKWSPKLERSRIVSIILSGESVGTVISFTLSGILCHSDFLGGWPSAYYVFGTVGCVWYILWITLVYETPHIHPSISKEEILKFEDVSYWTDKNRKIPWKSISKSLPFMAAILANFGESYGFTMFLTETPTYLNSVLNLNIRASGILSSLPYIANAVGSWAFPFIADKWIASGKTGTTTIRKIFNTISGFGPCVCLIVITYSGCESVLIISMLTLGMFLAGCKGSGYGAALVDMTPDYSGVLYGISNGVAGLSGIIAPTIVGSLTSSGATLANWSKVFLITAGVYFFAALCFALYGSSDLQPWGKASKKAESPIAIHTVDLNTNVGI